MSRFKTTLPVDVTAVLKSFPKGTNIESVEFNKGSHEVEIVWGNETLVTPYTFPVEYPLEALRGGEGRPLCIKPLDTKADEADKSASETPPVKLPVTSGSEAKSVAVPVAVAEDVSAGVEPVASRKPRKVPRK